MRCNHVASTSFRSHVHSRFLTNQCQIITFLILKSDIIENSRIELRGIVLPALQIKLKLHLLLLYPSTWYICDYFLFHIEIKGKGGWIILGGGRAKGMPPSQIIGGRWLAPSSYAYGRGCVSKCSVNNVSEEYRVKPRELFIGLLSLLMNSFYGRHTKCCVSMTGSWCS